MNISFKYIIPALILLIALFYPGCHSSEYLNIEDARAKLTSIEEELGNNPKDEKLLYEAAYIYWRHLADVDKAEKFLRRLLGINQKNIDAHYCLALVLNKRGRYTESVHHFREFIRLLESPQESDAEFIAYAESMIDAYERVSVDEAEVLNWKEEGDSATNSIGMTFIRIPKGTFKRRYGKEWYEVTLDAYWIGEYEVTAGQFQQFLEESGYNTGYLTELGAINDYARTKDYPVTFVRWQDAVAFTKWLSSRESAIYRLPSEAEWEFAAHGSEVRANPWGDEEAVEGVHANVHRLELADYFGAKPTLDKVGSYPAGKSYFGLYDMAGNVAEWCLDIYDSKFYRKSPAQNPFGPVYVEGKRWRVLRGSSWRHLGYPTDFAVTRDSYDPTVAYNQFGFRVVREIETYRINSLKQFTP